MIHYVKANNGNAYVLNTNNLPTKIIEEFNREMGDSLTHYSAKGITAVALFTPLLLNAVHRDPKTPAKMAVYEFSVDQSAGIAARAAETAAQAAQAVQVAKTTKASAQVIQMAEKAAQSARATAEAAHQVATGLLVV